METLKREQVRAVSRIETRFPLGVVCITPAAAQVVAPDEVTAALVRHGSGDWGDLSPEDVLANERAVERGARLVSSYAAANGETFWLITEADRSVTTVLLPIDS